MLALRRTSGQGTGTQSRFRHPWNGSAGPLADDALPSRRTRRRLLPWPVHGTWTRHRPEPRSDRPRLVVAVTVIPHGGARVGPVAVTSRSRSGARTAGSGPG